MQGIKRRIIYVAIYEALAILASSMLLSAGSDSGFGHAGIIAVVASAIAVIWNLLFNTVFERVEAHLGLRGRGLLNRVIHAVCFEGGLVVFLTPVFAWWLAISLWHAFVLNLGLTIFFVCYTFGYNWAFDRIFGLPASVQSHEAAEIA